MALSNPDLPRVTHEALSELISTFLSSHPSKRTPAIPAAPKYFYNDSHFP